MKHNLLLQLPNRFADACLSSCRQILSQIQQTRDAVLREFDEIADKHLLTLALNEAEALAQQTPFPHLFFPTLALEKAQALRNWDVRQQALRQQGRAASSLAGF